MKMLRIVFCVFTILAVLKNGHAQGMYRTKVNTPVSQLIANGAEEEVILQAWEETLLQRKIQTYDEAKQLLNQTFQMAYVQGNRYLSGAMAKTAYYSSLNVILGKELAGVKTMLQGSVAIHWIEKNYKLKPENKDLQKLVNVSEVDIERLKTQHFTLVEQTNSVLATVPNMQNPKTAKPPVTGKNQRQPSTNLMFNESEVTFGEGVAIKDKGALLAYLQRLEGIAKTVDTNLKAAATHLQNTLITQQEMTQNESILSKKMLEKAATIID